MADTSQQILRYKTHLEKNPSEERLLQILNKLSRLPITLDLLQETGIGKTVNGFRKKGGEIGGTAKALVGYWKTLVAEQAHSHRGHGDERSPEANQESESENDSSYVSQSHNRSHNGSAKSDQSKSSSHHKHSKESSKHHKKEREEKRLVDERNKQNNHRERVSEKNSKSKKEFRSPSPKSESSEQEMEYNDSENEGLPDIKGSNSDDESAEEHSPAWREEETQETNISSKHRSSKHRDNEYHNSSKTSDSSKTSKPQKVSKKHSSKHSREGDGGSMLFSPDETIKIVHKTRPPSKPEQTSHREDVSPSSPDKPSVSKKASDKKGTKRPADKQLDEIDFSESSRKSAKRENPAVEQSPSDLEEDNGFSFEDFLSYDQPAVNKALKKKKVKMPETTTETKKSHSSEGKSNSKSHSSNSHSKSHSSSNNSHSKSHSSSSNSHSKSHSSSSNSHSKSPSSSSNSHSKSHSSSSNSHQKSHSSSSNSHSEKSHPKSDSKSSSSKSHSSSDKSRSHSNSERKHSSSSKKDSSSRKNESAKESTSATSRETTDALCIPKPPKQAIRLTDEDIQGYLPETQAYYKPLRFQGYDPEESKHNKVVDPMLIGSKSYSRTQVYSGRKNTGMTEMVSLYELCMRVLMDNIDGLDYVGGVPYDILKPVLEKCTAEQLYRLEDFNPQFVGETEELWQLLCNRDFRGSKPDEMESWRELYLRRFDEREAKLQKLKANIAASEEARKAPVRHTKLAYVDTVAKPPRDVRRRQMKYGTASVETSGSSSKPNPAGYQRSSLKSRLAMDTAPTPQKKAVKMVAPMMQKTMKMIKKLQRR